MGDGNMLPELRIFAGPNGSGKSTVTELFGQAGVYINADDIARTSGLTVLEAAQYADEWRVQCLDSRITFTSETVLSSTRKLILMEDARKRGFFIKGIFVFTTDPGVNVARVRSRVHLGGHDVPLDKIYSRYYKSLSNLPRFIELCDVCHVVDNTEVPIRIFKKQKYLERWIPSTTWNRERIEQLVRCGSIS